MPTATGRAFTTANFLTNLAALKAINFGGSDPNGTWFIVPNQTTNNVEIWVWEPASTAVTNEIDVIRPDSIISNAPGRCIQRLRFDASSLGGILAAIVALNTAGLIERTASGSAAIVGLGAFGRSFLGSISDSSARTALGLDQVTNTSDASKPVSTAQLTALNLKANLASPTFTGTPSVPTAVAGTNTTQAANTAFVTSGLASKADLVGGVVPASQIPGSYDDVLEFANLAAFPPTGETGKIYIAIDTNLTYRWTGSVYAGMSSSLALGTTLNTAYRGDFGDIAYQHSQIIAGNPHGVTAASINLGNLTNHLQVNTTETQVIGGVKTFTSIPRIQAAAPGFWLDETDHTQKGAYLLIDGGVFQVQRRATNFGAFEAILAQLDIINGVLKLNVNVASTSTTTGTFVCAGGGGFGNGLSVIGTINFALPTSPTGLSAGSLWRNGNAVNVV